MRPRWGVIPGAVVFLPVPCPLPCPRDGSQARKGAGGKKASPPSAGKRDGGETGRRGAAQIFAPPMAPRMALAMAMTMLSTMFQRGLFMCF